jgi:hypothetical protein
VASKTMTVDQVLSMSEQLSPTDQLRLISLLSERLRDDIARDDIALEREPIDLLSLTGLGAEVWQAVDVADYLEQERASWNR